MAVDALKALHIIRERLAKRASVLEAAGMREYVIAAMEMRRFEEMAAKAIAHILPPSPEK